LGVVGAYTLAIRPRLLRWGATGEEVRRTYPGAELVLGGTRSATMAVTIDAPPGRVWPWLAQMGYGRAGWYSWDHLDNLGQSSAWRLHPEWQDIHLGDFLAPEEGPVARSWEVAALDSRRFLGLRASYDLRRGRWFDPAGPRPPFSTLSLWGFLLEEAPGGRTRLIVSGYWSLRPRWLQPILSVLVFEPSHWIMQTRQFTNLKRRAEGTRAAKPAPRTDAAGSQAPAIATGIGRARRQPG
jgi:proline iminopeptidase